jgi:hypothetical protein
MRNYPKSYRLRRGVLDMAKLYIDGAVSATRVAQKYLVRYQPSLVAGATAGQIVALTNLITCIAAFLVEWHKVPPNN